MNDGTVMQEVAAKHVPVEQFSFEDMKKMAESIAKSELFGLSKPNDVFVLLLQAQSEGRHPATVVRDYDVIKGKPAKKAEAMLRDFLAAGGSVVWHELTSERAEATFRHPQGGTIRLDWDMARAERAGLSGKDNYKKWDRQMLRCRLISEGTRTIYPAATSGMYTPEELLHGEVVNDSRTSEKTNELNSALGIEAAVEGGEVKEEGPVPGESEGDSGSQEQEPAPQPSSTNRRESAKEQFRMDCAEMTLDYDTALVSLLTLRKKDTGASLKAEDYAWAHDNPGPFSAQVQYDLAAHDKE